MSIGFARAAAIFLDIVHTLANLGIAMSLINNVGVVGSFCGRVVLALLQQFKRSETAIIAKFYTWAQVLATTLIPGPVCPTHAEHSYPGSRDQWDLRKGWGSRKWEPRRG